MILRCELVRVAAKHVARAVRRVTRRPRVHHVARHVAHHATPRLRLVCHVVAALGGAALVGPSVPAPAAQTAPTPASIQPWPDVPNYTAAAFTPGQDAPIYFLPAVDAIEGMRVAANARAPLAVPEPSVLALLLTAVLFLLVIVGIADRRR